jgi:hypothetical protein
MADHEPMIDGGCAEPELSQELRAALALLSEHNDNREFRTLVNDVLTGQRSLLEAAGTAAFSNVVFASIAADFTRLTDEDARRLAAQAQAPPSEQGVGSCGLPCASCTKACAALRGHSETTRSHTL